MRLELNIQQKYCSERRVLDLKAFSLAHAELVSVSNGVCVAESLKKLYERIGQPLGVICDQGGDLRKGLDLLRTEHKINVTTIDDISHKTASIIKAKYDNMKWFKLFTKNISAGQQRITNTDAAYLRSPKQNTKARFMNISIIVNRAVLAIDKMGDRSQKSPAMKKFRKAYAGLRRNAKAMLPEFKKIIDVVNEIMKIMKTHGFTSETEDRSRRLLVQLPSDDQVTIGMEQWINDQSLILKTLNELGWHAPLPVSSDPIESLFSRYKALQGRAPQGDPTRLVLLLPLLVGEFSASDLTQLVRATSLKTAATWVKEKIPETLHSKKRRIGLRSSLEKRTKTGHTLEKRKRPYIRALAA